MKHTIRLLAWSTSLGLFACNAQNNDPIPDKPIRTQAPETQGTNNPSAGSDQSKDSLPGRGTPLTYTALAKISREQLDTIFEGLGPKAKNGIYIYGFTYVTTTPDPSPQSIKASGILIIPDSNAKVYPWISLQHGTIVSDADAPSVRPGEGVFEGAQGFVTVVMDYIGYGASKDIFHPYMIEQAYGDAGVDILKAARAFAATKQVKVGPLFLKGYSEGGYATLALQKALETKYPNEFQLVASAPSAGPYDLETTGRILLAKDKANPINIPFVLLSYARWKDQQKAFDPADFFAIPVETVNPLFSGAYTNEDVYKALPTATEELFKAATITDFVADEPQLPSVKLFRSWLVKESLHNQDWVPTTPTVFFHCTDDEAVPVEASRVTVAAFKAKNPNAQVVLQEIPSPEGSTPYTHVTCPAIYSPTLWFSRVLQK